MLERKVLPYSASLNSSAFVIIQDSSIKKTIVFLALEGFLRDTYVSELDRCVDLAVRDFWLDYQPGPRRWEPMQPPKSH